MIEDGWLGIGRKKDVPKCACYVGRCCDTYVWVLPSVQDKLARLTLAVLDILTIDSTGASATLAGLPRPGYRLTPEMIKALDDTIAPANVKARLRDQLGISYKTVGEFRQAVRRTLTVAKVPERNIDLILDTLESMVTGVSFVLTEGVIAELQFPEAFKKVLRDLPVKQFGSAEALRREVRGALSGANAADQDLTRMLDEVESRVPRRTSPPPPKEPPFRLTPRLTPSVLAPPPTSSPP